MLKEHKLFLFCNIELLENSALPGVVSLQSKLGMKRE